VADRIARSIVLAALPDGPVKESDFRFETSSVPEPRENEMLLETQYLAGAGGIEPPNGGIKISLISQ
jgi:NADPH-dependent curcumin reductase CurA